MTREEAIVYFESLLKRFEEMRETETSYWGKAHTETTIEATRLALTALRPVSREQVEKMRGVWIPVRESEITGWDLALAGYDPIGGYVCSQCKTEAALDCNDEFALGNFCPHCGAPMTDEAVEMVMERLERMKDVGRA